MKKLMAILLSLTLSLGGCAALAEAAPTATPAPVEMVVFAAASMTESLTQIAELYKAVAPNVTLTFNFDSSGTLQTQIEEGAQADIFISAGQKQMNELDASADAEKNPKAQDFVLQGTRFDLLTNTVVLIVPEGSDKGITSFDDVATDKVSLIALGNSDVPVGQYAQDIFTSLGVWDQLNAEKKDHLRFQCKRSAFAGGERGRGLRRSVHFRRDHRQRHHGGRHRSRRQP